MLEILIWLEKKIAEIDFGDLVSFTIPDPDLREKCSPEIPSKSNTSTPLYHSWKAWNDLAELLYCRILTPQPLDNDELLLYYRKLDPSNSFHRSSDPDKREKYGTKSLFATIRKNEESSFLFPFRRALQKVGIAERKTVLDLGVNSGDEFELIRMMVKESAFEELQLIGIDHSGSAIEEAKTRFPEENITFHRHDINRLDELSLPKADLILSIGTLQSPGIDFKPLFMSLIQNYLSENGAILLGFPNCRWIDGEMIYGATAPNYNFPEMSLVIKDIYFCKKYLQQHRFRVTITGKDYLFLTATKIDRKQP